MVATNTTLTRLNLAKNSLGAHGFELLLPAMRFNIGLRSVSLAMNCRTTDAILFVSRALKSTRTLRKIDLRSNPLGELGAQMVANALKANRSLTHLNVRNTSLDVKVRRRWVGRGRALPPPHPIPLAATHASQSLLHLKNAIMFSKLWTVDLSYNKLGPEGAHLLAAVVPKSSMTALNLSNCFLTARGASQLGRLLWAHCVHVLIVGVVRCARAGCGR